MIRRPLISALSLALLVALPAFGAQTFTIDNAHSEVSFQVRHLVSTVRGEFNEFQGTIVRHPEDPSRSSVEFTIDAASIDTENERRDNHLRTEDFFWVDEHPALHFESSTVKEVSENRYLVTGTLTIRGVSKEITLPVEYTGTVKDPWGNVKAGFSTSTTLNRKEFGINWNKSLDEGGYLLGDEVTINIDLATDLKQDETSK